MASFLRAGSVALTMSALTLGGITMACDSFDPEAGRPPEGKITQAKFFVSNRSIESMDLVLVIDNSQSMRDKQPLLRESLVQAVRRLIQPDCIDENGNVIGFTEERACAQGSPASRMRDLRVAVLSSSLGGHGSGLCPREVQGMDDRGHLIPSVRPGAPDPLGTGFLWWRDGSDQDAEQFLEALRGQIEAVGSSGCEFEAPLESWYRFLIDPAPPQRIVVSEEGRSDAERDTAGAILIDAEVLAQRERFLRPDGLVGILVVSDENDCSVMDGGVAYRGANLGHRLLGPAGTMPRPSAVCAQNPNDPCCFSCADAAAHPECSPKGCEAGATLSAEEDPVELRCFEPMRRFGRDLRYPVTRYADALSRPELLDARTGMSFDNPLLRGAGRRHGRARDPGLVFFGMLGGLPWQDVAAPNSLDPNVPYTDLLSAAELGVANVDVGVGSPIDRWEVLLGLPGSARNGPLPCDPSEDESCGRVPVPPWDPFLIESVEPRADAENPISGDWILAPQVLAKNSTNGHDSGPWRAESSVSAQLRDGGVMQPACIFELAESIECAKDEEGAPDQAACACTAETAADASAPRARAICESPGGSPASTTQYFAEAYPAPRQLSLAKLFGANAVVASLCPKNPIAGRPVPADDPEFAYNRLLDALNQRLSDDGLDFRCGAPQMTPDAQGQVGCTVIEGILPPQVDFIEEAPLLQDCEARGRQPVTEKMRALFLEAMEKGRLCGPETSIDCGVYQTCELPQLSGDDGLACRTDPRADELHPTPGFCYVDTSDYDPRFEENLGGSGNRAGDYRARLLNCPSTERRTLRFVGYDTPSPNAMHFVLCSDLELSDD